MRGTAMPGSRKEAALPEARAPATAPPLQVGSAKMYTVDGATVGPTSAVPLSRKVAALVLLGDAGEVATSVGTLSWLSTRNAREGLTPGCPFDDAPAAVSVRAPSGSAEVSTPVKSTWAGALAPKPCEGAVTVA